MSIDTEETWDLKLYVAGKTEKSLAAIKNLNKYCEANLPGQYTIEIIDLYVEPFRAQIDMILAIPTLVRKHPRPMKKIIGDLSDEAKVLSGLEIKKKTIK